VKNAADVMAESPIVTGITIRHRIVGTGPPPAIGVLAAGLVGEDPVKLDADQWRVVFWSTVLTRYVQHSGPTADRQRLDQG
jgi:hypothetical protein